MTDGRGLFLIRGLSQKFENLLRLMRVIGHKPVVIKHSIDPTVSTLSYRPTREH